jgi:hypothetical protein
MQPESYRAAARRLRKFADQFEARCAPSTPREQAALTLTINVLSHYVALLSARHHKRPLLGAQDEHQE